MCKHLVEHLYCQGKGCKEVLVTRDDVESCNQCRVANLPPGMCSDGMQEIVNSHPDTTKVPLWYCPQHAAQQLSRNAAEEAIGFSDEDDRAFIPELVKPASSLRGDAKPWYPQDTQKPLGRQ